MRQGGISINSSSISCRARSVLSLLRPISYIPYWLPTAPHPVAPEPTYLLPTNWGGCMGGCPGLGCAPVRCYLAGPVLPPTLPTSARPCPYLPGGTIHIVQRVQSAACMGLTAESMCIHVPDPHSRSGLSVSPPFGPGGMQRGLPKRVPYSTGVSFGLRLSALSGGGVGGNVIKS